MRRGQFFIVDLMLALAVIVLAIGLVTNAWSWQLQQSASAVEHAKMQQIAIDAAAVEYYNGYSEDYLGLNGTTALGGPASARLLGYTLSRSPLPGMTCIGSIRGTETSQVGVFVCRGE